MILSHIAVKFKYPGNKPVILPEYKKCAAYPQNYLHQGITVSVCLLRILKFQAKKNLVVPIHKYLTSSKMFFIKVIQLWNKLPHYTKSESNYLLTLLIWPLQPVTVLGLS